MKTGLLLTLCSLIFSAFISDNLQFTLRRSATIDSLGACQGISYQQGKVYLYGDREVGMIRVFDINGDKLTYTNQEYKLTVGGQDVINHPTGIASNGNGPVFIGNSIRLNPEGTRWKAVIYAVDWAGLQRTKTLDGNLLNTIEDDACMQGTRPEYVRYNNRWYIATADYGDKANEVRLYDPERLRTAQKTSDPGVLVKKFSCSPWVQNLHWIPEKGLLVLIQNQIEGRKWRFTFLDLNQSLASGTEQVVKVIDTDKPDELEGFALTGDLAQGIAATSSRTNNVHFTHLAW